MKSYMHEIFRDIAVLKDNPVCFFNFANVLIFLVVGCLFVVLNLTVSRLLQTKIFSGEKYIPYECGEDPIGDTRIKFNTRFYVIALIFLIFDVEVVFLFPWAVVFPRLRTLRIFGDCSFSSLFC